MRKLAAIGRPLGKALGAVIGIDECVLTLGLILLSAGLWPTFGRASLIAPGIVLVWMALPQRAPLVRREPQVQVRKRT